MSAIFENYTYKRVIMTYPQCDFDNKGTYDTFQTIPVLSILVPSNPY